MRRTLIPTAIVAFFPLLTVSLGSVSGRAAEPSYHLDNTGGALLLPDGGWRDSILTWGDEQYESGLIWQYGGVVPPDFGAFAECFSGDWLAVAVVLDFTRNDYNQGSHTYDAYLWDDDAGLPGAVLALTAGIDPGPIAEFPEYSRHFGEYAAPVPVQGTWYVGFWPDWPGEAPGWFLACDHSGSTGGCMLTKIAPGIDYPTGWQDLQIIWGPHTSVGVSALVRPNPPVPAAGSSWGAIKALYR